jgi:hypothetical protein
MLKGDTGLLPQRDAKRYESQRKPEHSLSRRQPDIAARFLQYSKFLARYSSVPAAGKYRKSKTHWTCVVQPGRKPWVCLVYRQRQGRARSGCNPRHRIPPQLVQPVGLAVKRRTGARACRAETRSGVQRYNSQVGQECPTYNQPRISRNGRTHVARYVSMLPRQEDR